MAENVVGGQGVELLAVDHVVTLQGFANCVDHHRVRNIDVERVFVAVLASQRVRARADLHEQAFVSFRHLHNGHGRG